jgi:hypothetical protein
MGRPAETSEFKGATLYFFFPSNASTLMAGNNLVVYGRHRLGREML